LAAGNFMEPSAILLIMAPILFPIATQLGIIMVVDREVGMLAPPAARTCSWRRARTQRTPPSRGCSRPGGIAPKVAIRNDDKTEEAAAGIVEPATLDAVHFRLIAPPASRNRYD
jgi:hypothetical protein